METCPICNTNFIKSKMMCINEYDCFCKECFFTWVKQVNLGIDIELADYDEWYITATEDTFDDNQTLRLRNPKTNLPFNENELKYIYNFYHEQARNISTSMGEYTGVNWAVATPDINP